MVGRVERDLLDMVSWSGIVSQTSRCLLGATSPNPILSTLAKFPELYEDKVRYQQRDRLLLSFDADDALGGFDTAITALNDREGRLSISITIDGMR